MFSGPEGELPPLIVASSWWSDQLDLDRIAFANPDWTSRGFAVLDVDYGGSTNYGREYRERLNDNWGIVDIDDCMNGANT